MKRITLLGATGSVGSSTLDLIGRHRDRFAIEAVTANGDAEGLARIARDHGARFAAVADEAAYPALKAALAGSGIEAAAGREAIAHAAARPTDLVLAAISGAAGVEPVLAAIGQGTTVALANKESLVAAASGYSPSIPSIMPSSRRLPGRASRMSRPSGSPPRAARSVPGTLPALPPRFRPTRSSTRTMPWGRRSPLIPPA